MDSAVNPESSRPHLLDNEEDYFNIDQCYATEDHQRQGPKNLEPTESGPVERHTQSDDVLTTQTQLPKLKSSRTQNSQSELPNLTENGTYWSGNHGNGHLSDDSDYSDTEEYPSITNGVVREEVDYVNSSEVDRELAIDTKPGNVVNSLASRSIRKKLEDSEHVYQNMESELGAQEGPDYENLDDKLKISDQDYENSEAIDAQLFSDNIRAKDDASASNSSTSLGLPDHPLLTSEGVVKEENSPEGVVLRQQYSPERKCSTLHRESEIKIELFDSTADSLTPAPLDPTVLNTAVANSTEVSHSLALTERVKSSITPFSNQPSYRGHSNRTPDPDLSTLGTLERTLLQTNGPVNAPIPNVLELPWYHEGITRHIAESLLMAKTIRDGTYLLRDSLHGNNSLTLSVRCPQSVKHYRVVWDGKQFTFGLGNFPDLKSLKEHFDNQPIISGESGILVQLCYPYPRAVAEPAIYFDPEPVEGDKKESSGASAVGTEKVVAKKWTKKDKGAKPASTSQPELSVNSKEGYLTKQGYRVKNWKRRWFVLYRNELRYYVNQEAREPLRVIDLNDVSAVERDESQAKNHCFKLVTSYRTFFIYGASEVEATEWMQILDWKVGRRSRSNSQAQ